MTSSKKYYKEKIARRKEEKAEEAKNQSSQSTDTELRSEERIKIQIMSQLNSVRFMLLLLLEPSIFGQLMLTRYPLRRASALRKSKEDQQLSFRTAAAKSVYQWMVKPQTVKKTNKMFLPGRMAFIFNMEGGYFNDIPTTLHRSKADCPVADVVWAIFILMLDSVSVFDYIVIVQEMVTVNVDGSVLDQISKILSYLRLGSSGKVLKKKKKERDAKGKILSLGNESDEEYKPSKHNDGISNGRTEKEILPPPPPPIRKNL